MSQHRLQALRATVLAVCIGFDAGAAAAAGTALDAGTAATPRGPTSAEIIRLTDAQIRAAGIRVEPARASSEAGAGQQTGLRLTGQVVTPGNRTGVVPSAVAGHLDTVLVQIGQRVHAGEPLARLYSAELAGLQRSYLHAKSASGLASGRVARDQSLFDEGIIAESRLRESQAAFQMARATEQEQRRLLSLAGYTAPEIESLRPETISTSVTLRAPEDGIVLDQAVPVGQHVEPGATLFRLASAGDWWLELEAAGSQVREIQVGDSVRVSGCRVDGRVIAVGSQFRAASQTIPVRAVMPEAGTCLSPNQFLEASVLRNATSANLVRVPAAALIRNSDREYLFIQRATGFQPVPVTVERREGENVLLRPGGAIEPGIKVAVGGLFVLKGAWLGLGAPGAAEGQH